MSLWATKSVTDLRAEAEGAGEHALKRALGPLNLVTLGIGAIVGAGIFVLTGQAAAPGSARRISPASSPASPSGRRPGCCRCSCWGSW